MTGLGSTCAHCPACERYIGTVAVCPYCETDAVHALHHRLLRRFSLVLAVTAVALIYVRAQGVSAPRVEAASVTPMMNFAWVTVAGTVVRPPFVSREEGEGAYLSFVLDDGTGRFRVAAYREVADELIESNTIPEVGDHVRVTGSLDVAARRTPRLRLASAHQVVGQSEASCE